MNLFKIIRRKFLPPNGIDSKVYCSSMKKYEIDHGCTGGTYTCYIQYIGENRKYFPKKSNKTSDAFNNCAVTDETINWFDTPEEARECAWDSFDNFYKSSMIHKKVG